MTDEELRQQYGIQLASRPIDSGDGKEAKWADIDDDEDDWAPETIEWNDGTKINLSQVDTAPTMEQLADTEKSNEILRDQEPTATTSTKIAPSLGPKPTVLKLGASISSQPKPPSLGMDSPQQQQQQQQQQLKSFNDKPTLVAKPSPAPPPKNPWAQLPPVDKYSPVTPPVQQHAQARFFPESMPPPPPPSAPQYPSQPAKEIAADDFSRFPRDGTSGTPRELFNSQSGRYEPVADGKRTSKKDQGFRAPAVLQRPSASDPAEPSPAFQTNRSQQQDAAAQWRRRRASSNISGDNGIFARRMSMTTSAKDMTSSGQRRDSQLERPLTPSVSSATAKSVTSPVISHAQPITSQSPSLNVQTVSTQQSPVPQIPHHAPPQTPATTFAHTTPEDVKMQKNLMKEKAEAAHKRRIEEEQRQEAEKRERLRVKMEQLGLTSGEKSSKKTTETEEEAPPLPPNVPFDPKNDPVSQIPATAKAASPPKPPVPTANGAPQQYGLMKVHAPQVVSPTDRNSESDMLRNTTQQTKGSTRKEPVPQSNGERQNKMEDFGASSDNVEKPVLPTLPPSTGYQGWPQHSMATHSVPGGNVWAAPAHKGLGNGDFQKRVQVSPAQQQIHQQPYPPPPPPQQLQNQPPPPQPQPQSLGVSPQVQPPPIGTPRQTVPYNNSTRPPISEPPVVSLPRHVDALAPQHPTPNFVASNNHNHFHMAPPATIIDQDITQKIMATTQREHMPPPPPKSGMAIWNDFANNAAAYDTKAREKITQEHAASLAALTAEHERTGKPIPTGPVFNETWNKVVKGENLGSRQVVASVKTQRDSAAAAVAAAATETTMVPPIRSRFQDIFDKTDGSIQAMSDTPPAEIESHPVFGPTQRPVVNLPGSKVRMFDHHIEEDETQKPIVRLPPPKSLGADIAIATSLSPLRAQPFIANPTWQDRINGLFDRKAPLEKRVWDSVEFSESKPSYLELLTVESTFVTLPPSTELPSMLPQKSVEEEDALFEEERDFGSVPTVRIPAMAPPPAWNPAKPYNHQKRMKMMALQDAAILSGVSFVPGLDDLSSQRDIPIVIKLGGMVTPKIRLLSRPSNSKQPRQSHTNVRGKPRSHGHPKGRDQSTPLTSSTPGQLNTGGRQSARQSGGPQRKPSSNIGNQTWAGRVSGLV